MRRPGRSVLRCTPSSGVATVATQRVLQHVVGRCNAWSGVATGRRALYRAGARLARVHRRRRRRGLHESPQNVRCEGAARQVVPLGPLPLSRVPLSPLPLRESIHTMWRRPRRRPSTRAATRRPKRRTPVHATPVLPGAATCRPRSLRRGPRSGRRGARAKQREAAPRSDRRGALLRKRAKPKRAEMSRGPPVLPPSRPWVS